MVYENFEQMIEKVRTFSAAKRMAIAVAADEATLKAALEAKQKGIVVPVLVGEKRRILDILAGMGEKENVPDADIHDEPDDVEACKLAVQLVRTGNADFLMKGKIDTHVLLKEVVDKENGLKKGELMSHLSMFDVPGYHKILVPVDGGMVAYPTLEQKKSIIENTVGALLDMGYTCPKVGVLACAEKVNPKMPEMVEADALKQMNRRGEIRNCIVDGPVSYDCAISKEAAAIKGYESEIAGDVDVLLVPNIHAGNIMGKMLAYTCGARMAGFVVGGRCPIVLTSRGASSEEKFLSIAVSAAASG
ncbi:MAG: phosphate butyryltransferase [Synergistaceae bacterium]|jgi:phosphate butyryltransferase|nr:phosphate butyryltransferase [Synergistaceae bacterium]